MCEQDREFKKYKRKNDLFSHFIDNNNRSGWHSLPFFFDYCWKSHFIWTSLRNSVRINSDNIYLLNTIMKEKTFHVKTNVGVELNNFSLFSFLGIKSITEYIIEIFSFQVWIASTQITSINWFEQQLAAKEPIWWNENSLIIDAKNSTNRDKQQTKSLLIDSKLQRNVFPVFLW